MAPANREEGLHYIPIYPVVSMASSIEHGEGCVNSTEVEAAYIIDNTKAADLSVNLQKTFNSQTYYFSNFGASSSNAFYNNLESTPYIDPCYQQLDMVFDKSMHENLNTFDNIHSTNIFSRYEYRFFTRRS